MAEKNTVPNLEAKASDGNPLFTPCRDPRGATEII